MLDFGVNWPSARDFITPLYNIIAGLSQSTLKVNIIPGSRADKADLPIGSINQTLRGAGGSGVLADFFSPPKEKSQD